MMIYVLDRIENIVEKGKNDETALSKKKESASERTYMSMSINISFGELAP